MSDTLNKPGTLSVRLSPGERDALLARAGTQTLSSYVKQVLFDGAPADARRKPRTQADRQLLAQLLATLGGSNLAASLQRLAADAESGNVLVDDDTTRRLRQACDDVRLMHNALMRGLGMKERASSLHEVRAREAFNASAQPEDQP